MKHYSIEPFSVTDFNQLIPLMKHCFGMEVDLNYFKWKYLDNPAGAVVAAVARDVKNEIIGFYSNIPQLYKSKNEEKIIYQACDAMTHASYRRMGVFENLVTKTHEMLAEMNALNVVAFSGQTSTPGFYKFGWKKVIDLPYYFKPKQVLQFRRIIGKISWKDISIKPITDFDGLANFINQHEHSANYFNRKKDAQFLRWRFANPKVKYSVLGCYETGNNLTGYIIFSENKTAVVILDFLALNQRAEKSLLQQGQELVLKNKRKAILCLTQPSRPLAALLIKNGFLKNSLGFGPLKNKIPFIYFSNQDGFKKYLAAENWNMVPIDNDNF